MQLIPSQYKGRSIQAISSRDFPNDSDAHSFFETTRQRLEHVNDWQTWAGAALAQFTLVNSDGKDVYRPPIVGDHFKIDVPGPGSAEGQGYDWVQIEAIEQEVNADSAHYGFTVRPSSNPERSTIETAHFYSDESTSTFLVRRNGKIVSVEVYDRNITPNTDAKRTTDKVRNSLVGAMGTSTFSKLQWQSLTDGLICD